MIAAQTNPRVVSLPTILVTLILAFLAYGSLYAQRQPVPRAQFQAGQTLAMRTAGLPAGVSAGQLEPLAMVSADFDGDGVADLAVGYADGKGGAIALLRGNLDALAPQSQESWLAASQGHYASPFLAQDEMIPVPARPDLLHAADLFGDGRQDLVFAARNGHQLYILRGDGKGNFVLQSPVSVAGTITALAAYKPGDNLTSDALIVGVNTASGSSVAIFRTAGNLLQQEASYTVPGAVSSIEVANLDAGFTPDAATVAGGQLLVLHGANALTGEARLETLPISGVQAVAAGEFLFDRHAQLQLSAITTDGTVHILAHEGFDARPYTHQEMLAARRNSAAPNGAQTLAQIAGNTGGEPWTEIENMPGVASFGSAATPPILLRSKPFGSGAEGLVVLNAAQQEIVTLHHSNAATAPGQTSIFHSTLSSGAPVAALSLPLTPQGVNGLVVLSQGSIQPEYQKPLFSGSITVNTLIDSADPLDGTRCVTSSETCSLRDAVAQANQDNDGDTINLPLGTYNLTLNQGVKDGNGNATTHLDITGPMTITGAGAGTTIINAGNYDKVFSIDPDLDSAFSTTLSGVTLENGKNSNNPASATDNYGGAIDWEAYGTGHLTITSCIIQNSTALYGPGGAIYESNELGGSGLLSISNSTISGNKTPEVGGGVNADYGAAVAISNSIFSSNEAKLSVNSSDPNAVGQGGGLYTNARGSIATPQSTIASGSSFTSNQSDSDGGGIYTNTGLSITGDTLFTSNTSGGSGGAIFHDTANNGVAETTTISAANFSANTAVTTGGAITVGEQTKASGNLLTVANSRFYGNTSTNGASGLSVGLPGESSGTGAGGVTAVENWWGCNAGPASTGDGCDQARLYDASTGSLTVSPNVILTLGVNPGSAAVGSPFQLNAAVNTNSSSGSVPNGPGALQGLDIAFAATVNSYTATPANIAIDSTGAATTSVTPTSTGTGSATATLDHQIVSASFSVEGLDHFLVSAPATINSGAPFSVTVTALDASNDTFTGYTGTIHFSSTDTASGVVLPANATLTNGTGAFSATLVTPGSQSFSVKDTVATTATGSASVTVEAPTLAIDMSTAGNFIQGSSGQWLIQVSNIGNMPTSGTVTLSDSLPVGYSLAGYSGAGWSCSGTTIVTCASTQSVAAGGNDSLLSISVMVPANSPVTVTSILNLWGGGDPVHTSSSSAIIQGFNTTVLQVPSSINITAGNGQSAIVTQAFAMNLKVTILDAGGVAIPNASVTFTAPNSGASGTFAGGTNTIAVTTNASGVATAPAYTANTIAGGAYSLTASAGAGVSTNFSMTNLPGPASLMTANAGTTPQSAFENTTFANALAVTVTDAYGNLASGVNVTFSAPASGVGGTFSNSTNTITAATSVTGIATAPFTANSTAGGPYTVTAAAAGLTTIDFSLTNTPPVNFVVTTHLDDTGSAGNCTQQTTPGTGTDSSCSLRDALLAAETVGAVNISFSSADFNAANTTALNTITLTNGTLVIPTNTTISGPTTGSGATLTNLVTVDGNGSVIDFTVPNGVNAEIDNLIITGGHSLLYGGGISIQGALKLNSCTFTGNTANQGGAIYNQGTVTVTNSTFTGNSADSLGGGIEIDLGSATVTGSTFSGNSSMHGGGIDIGDGSMTVINSTFSGNLANAGGEGGGGIYNCGGGTLTLLNSSFAENSNGGLVNCQPLTMYNTAFADDFYNNASSYTGSGNATSSVLFSPLANYGGPTQTMIPLADTSAICAGIASPTGLILPTTDQRGAGFPRVNTTYPGYSNATPCVDAGSVQSNYTMAFTTEPPATVAGNVPFTAANAPQVTLSEEGNMAAFANSGTVTASGAPATVGGTTSETFSAGVGAFTGLTITAASSSETLTATLNLNPNIPTLNLTAVSSIFAVTALTFSSTTLTSGMAGQSYSTQVPAVTGGSGSYSYALTTGSQLPTGLTLSGSGLITGTPTAASVTPYTFSITATDTVSTATANASFSLTINQGTPYLTWTQPTAITYETSLSGVLNAALQPAWSSVTGNITYTATPSGGVATTVTTATILNAGSYTLKAIFTPGDTADYLTETASVSLSVNQAMPVITWPAPAAITYGTALSGTQLDATASFNGSPVTGNYTYSPLAGTKLSAGASQTLSVTFVPGDTTNFATPPTATTTITVNQAMPVITWPAPAAITYGTPLSGTQLDATASFNGSPVSGNYTYSPLAGTKLGAGANQTLSVTFVPGDTTNFATPPVATTTITVNQAMPIITWPAPAAITYGTALSGTQLDATASFNGSPVTGTFTYLPLAGTKLNGGATQTLSVTFVPGDTTNFATPPAATTTITVNQVQSSILLASSANPVFVQNPISFTATVGDSLGALAAGPTGTVTFESNGAPIATCTGIALSANNLATGSATASCTITPSSVATNTITAIYNGDVNFLTSNSSPLPEAIVNFAFNMQNTTLKVIPGASAQYTFTVTPLDGVTVFPGPITLSVSNLPPGATWSFSSTNAQFSPSTNTIALGAGATTVTLTIQTAQIASVAQPGAGGNLAAQPDAFKLAPFTLALLLLPFVNRLRRAGKRFRRALPLLLLLGLSLVVAAGLGGCGSPDGFFGQAQRNYTVTVTGSSHELSNTTSVTLMVE